MFARWEKSGLSFMFSYASALMKGLQSRKAHVTARGRPQKWVEVPSELGNTRVWRSKSVRTSRSGNRKVGVAPGLRGATSITYLKKGARKGKKRGEMTTTTKRVNACVCVRRF